MKTKNIPFILCAIFAMVILSCSKSEENVPLNGGVNIASLTLTSDSSDAILAVDELVNFTAVGDDGVDYTGQASFFVNQTQITGSNYTFNTEGAFNVYAVYGNITSNTLAFNVVSGQRTVLIDAPKALRNQTITFSMVDADGNDVTPTATFFIDGTAITGNTFTSANAGMHEVYAQYDLAGNPEVTATKDFEVFIPKRKIVVEDYTGTWCGFCPSVAAAIEATHALTNDISIVAIHETANSNPDPYHFPQVQLLQDEFGVSGLPSARINRTTPWSSPYNSSDITSIAGLDTDLAIGISSQLAGNILTVDVNVIYETGSAAGDKLVLYLLESGLIYQQTNYYNTDPTSPYYQQGDPIPNFEHNEVLRQSLTGIFGDNIPTTAAFSAYSKTFTATIPADYNSNNLSLVAMVVRADNTARNSQFANVNENKNYE